MKQRTVFLTGPETVELREVDVPRPGDGEVLVRIAAATTCGTDVKVFRRGGHPRMLTVPTPFGHEMAGTVAAAGAGATQWREGDEVVVANSAPCGACAYCATRRENLCSDLHYLNGAYAEFILVPRRFAERSIYARPSSLPSEIAALAEPFACVVHGMEVLALSRAEEVVVFGAGPIGLLFVNALAAEGHRVTVADPNATRLAVARALGAVATIEVARDASAPFDIPFDVAIEATGSPAAWSSAIRSLRPGGTVLLFGGCSAGTTVDLDTHAVHYSELTLKGAYHHRPATFARALELLASGRVNPRLLLSAERPLEEVDDALRSMMRKEALKVVIRP